MKNPNWWKIYPFFYFPSKDKLKTDTDKWNWLRERAKKEISSSAQLKLEWIIFYSTVGKGNIRLTASHYGITRKTLHKWLSRFNQKQDLLSLEEQSRAPNHVRQRQVSLNQRIRIKSLRSKHPKYGKMKLVSIYEKEYREKLSSWKIQKIIEEGNLYPDKVKASKMRRKQVLSRIQKHKRITKLVKENKVNYLWHVDTIILTLPYGGYRYLLTAIDEVSKLAFARLYKNHSSRNAKDFLERMVYLTNNRVVNLHSDNGTEFKMEFEDACKTLSITQWYSRPHTPKDNSVLERFNRTIQEEFIELTDILPDDVEEFNKALLGWLIEYNFKRPHQTLAYKTPIEYLDDYYQKQKVSPMYSSPTDN